MPPVVMIANWNAVVRKDDRVIHVGDFAFKGDPKRLTKIFSALNGQKFLVIGELRVLAVRAHTATTVVTRVISPA